mgnify:CR=1 FL=1
MIKKYVFLTQSISGITGNQRYVNNKCNYLREKGWEVVVLWNYNVSPVELENVKCFDSEKYIHHELKFYPSWYSERQRNRVIERLVSVVGEADMTVVESNKLELGAWGELLAKRLHCKHINFVTTEGLAIRNQATFDYSYAKLLKNEFFNINPAAVTRFFSNFTRIENPEKYYWSAKQGVEVKAYPFPVFDNLPSADFTVTSFGRRKGYFPNMIEELRLFFIKHSDKSFNMFFLGDVSDENEIRDSLSLENVCLTIYPQGVQVIPSQIFAKSDVVIATAGCAGLSVHHGGKTISYDVNRNVPLGLLRYTTLDTNTYSGKYPNERSLDEWLDAILIDKAEFSLMAERNPVHDFDYQMPYVNDCDYHYIDSTKVKETMTRHDDFYAFLIRIGLFHLVEYCYYKRRGVNIIWR